MSPPAEQLDPESPARTGSADPGASPRPAVPRQARSPESLPQGAVESAVAHEAAGDPSLGGESAGDGQQTVEEVAPTALEAWLERLSRAARAAGSGTLELAVSNPLEFGAVALLGIGGAAWPLVLRGRGRGAAPGGGAGSGPRERCGIGGAGCVGRGLV